jgi:hypothetical protein
MKTGHVQDPGGGAEPYLEVNCWTPWQYYVPEEELEQYYEDANSLMMRLEAMPPAVRDRLQLIEIRCPVKGCLLATVYCMPCRPTVEEIEHERRINRLWGVNGLASEPQVSQPSHYLYVGRTAGGTEVYDLVDYPFDSIECSNTCIRYWRAGCRHGSASISAGYIFDMISISGRWLHFLEAEEKAVAGLPEHLRPFWGKRVFHPEPSAWRPKKRRPRPVISSLHSQKAHPCCVKVCEGSSRRRGAGPQRPDSDESPPQPPGVGYRGRPSKGCASMPRRDFTDGFQQEKTVHQTVKPSESLESMQLPWRQAGATAASLGAPVAIGILHPVLGEIIAVVEVVVVFTIIATALFGSQTLSDRAFRLLRWIGNRPEPPAPVS